MFAKADFGFIVLYPLSKGLILLGAGRECERDTPRRERKLASLAFPSLLRVSLSRSPFRDPLSPRGVGLAFGFCCVIAQRHFRKHLVMLLSA